MGKNYSVYLKDEEQVEFVEEMAEDVFGGNSALFQKAVEVLEEEKGDALRELKSKEDSDIIT